MCSTLDDVANFIQYVDLIVTIDRLWKIVMTMKPQNMTKNGYIVLREKTKILSYILSQPTPFIPGMELNVKTPQMNKVEDHLETARSEFSLFWSLNLPFHCRPLSTLDRNISDAE